MAPRTEIAHYGSTLWAMTRTERVRYLLATLSSTSSYFCILAMPLLGMYAVDVLIERDFAHANQWLLQITDSIPTNTPYVNYLIGSAIIGIVLTLFGSCFQFIRDRLSAVASENITLRLRETLFDRLHRARMSFFDKEEVGDLVQRCTSDVDTIRRFVHQDVDAVARALLFLAVMFPILWWRNPTLSWVSVLLMPLIVLGGIYFFRYIASMFQQMDESEGRLTSVLQENFTGIRVVQAFAQEESEYKRFSDANQDFRQKTTRLNTYEAIYWGLTDCICMIQTGVVLIVAVYLVTQNALTIGEMLLFVGLSGMVIWRIRQLVDIVEHAGKTIVALRRVSHILRAPQEKTQQTRPTTLSRGKVTFENVSLTYDGVNAKLRNIDLSINPGETIGVVGRPGSGKSSLVRALLRIYPISSGRIMLDDFDIHQADLQWLRQQVGCVLQEPFLFSRTIQENLKIGSANLNVHQLNQAVETADIGSTIRKFAAQFDTKIGERGVNLSGGQRQRLALARALLVDAPILILDDVLSGVDTATEASILNNLQSIDTSNRTIIIIAHRLTSVRHADRIVVMDNGEITQIGSHEELMAVTGYYRELCDIQAMLDDVIEYETQRAMHG